MHVKNWLWMTKYFFENKNGGIKFGHFQEKTSDPWKNKVVFQKTVQPLIYHTVQFSTHCSPYIPAREFSGEPVSEKISDNLLLTPGGGRIKRGALFKKLKKKTWCSDTLFSPVLHASTHKLRETMDGVHAITVCTHKNWSWTDVLSLSRCNSYSVHVSKPAAPTTVL